MSGFINGKLLDSLIIGILCLVCCNLLKFPYPALIAVVVGVTNIIPFFGPFIGAIPCGLLIFLVNPLQAVYFAIFILALQQFDGNILGPRFWGTPPVWPPSGCCSPFCCSAGCSALPGWYWVCLCSL